MRSSIYKILLPLTPLYDQVGKQRLRVLAYHTVPDKNFFEEQLVYLKSKYPIIDIWQLKRHLYNGEPLPENPLLITFDDGDITVLENGLPLLKKHGVPAALFVISELINTSRTFWCRRVEVVLQEEGVSYQKAREKVRELKNVPETSRREYINSLEDVQSRQLTVGELEDLSSAGVFICNHTHTHPMFNRCTEEEIRQELKATKLEFDKWKLKGYPYFAYPNGNWNERAEKILKEEGIELAFLFDHKINEKKINPLRISRIMIDADTGLSEFKVKISGLHPFLMKLKNKLR